MPEKVETINANSRKETTLTMTSKPRFSLLQKSCAKLKEIDGNNSKKVSFKVSEANAKAWVEETMMKINQKNGSVGTVYV